MYPKKFAEAAEEKRHEILTDDARVIVNGYMDDGRQIRVYRGRQPGETARSSLGHFLVVTTEHSRKGGKVTTQMIAAGSIAVRHPSYSTHFGRGDWTVDTQDGVLHMPAERAAEAGTPPSLGPDAIHPRPVAEAINGNPVAAAASSTVEAVVTVQLGADEQVPRGV